MSSAVSDLHALDAHRKSEIFSFWNLFFAQERSFYLTAVDERSGAEQLKQRFFDWFQPSPYKSATILA